MMRSEYNILALSALFILLFWAVDSVSDHLIELQRRHFLYALTDGENHRLFVRLFIVGCFLVFGIIASRMIARRRRAEETEHHSRRVAEAVGTVSLKYLETKSVSAMAETLAEHAVRITGADFGCVIDLGPRRQARLLAVAGRACERMQGSAVYEQVRQEIEAKGSYALSTDESPFFTPMMQGTSLLTNLSAEESKGFGNTPEIVPTIAGFLGVPIRIADQVVGMVALVNRPGGFTQRELSDAETLAGPAALTFHLAHDEEERERVEQQMHQTAKMEAMGRLAGGIAHDFNNLLTVIQGYAEVGLGAAGPDNRIRQCLVEIDEAADRGANLAQQLLAFSRRQHLQPRTVNINTVLLEMSRMLRCLIGENIEVEMDLAEHPRAIRVDPTQLQMLVLNLVINARDAMPEGGKLALETTNAHLDKKGASAHVGISSGDYVRLAVRDTGVGMTDEVKKHLFEPFFTTKDKGKGTGFGLATCYSIVRQGGGCIEVESRPGQGTQFEVYLPCVEEAPVEVHKPDQILTELPRGVETVLLVEDEPIVRTLAAHLLRDHGYNVLVGADGEEALRMVRENSCGTIDLLLTDVVMPRMGGRELVEQLKTVQPSLRKVLFMSGYADSPSPDNGDLQPDANVFLQKPFKPSALVRKVREVLDS